MKGAEQLVERHEAVAVVHLEILVVQVVGVVVGAAGKRPFFSTTLSKPL